MREEREKGRLRYDRKYCGEREMGPERGIIYIKLILQLVRM